MSEGTVRAPPIVDGDVFFFTYNDEGVTYELRRKFSSNEFSWMKSSEAMEARALLLNIKHNLYIRKFPLDFLVVLRNALFEKFKEFGVSPEMVESLVETFNVVGQAMKERADSDVEAVVSSERRSRSRRKVQ